jgi:Ran GTPase-activating protein (RanGAP) involved in mRNA processing and transport
MGRPLPPPRSKLLLWLCCAFAASGAWASEGDCNVQDTQHMRHLPVSCRQIKLAGAKLGDAAATHLGHLLGKYSKVVEVDLRRNLITDKGAGALARAISGAHGNGRLLRLQLAHNLITAVGAKLLGQALATNVGLQVLDLSHNEIAPAGGRALAAGLAANQRTPLSTLMLDGCNIGDMGVGAIAAALLHSPTLRTHMHTLSIQRTGVSALGASKLAAAIAIHSSQLRTLDLSHNRAVGDRGATKVFEALLTNKHLRNLVLANCGISEMAAGTLATALGQNTRLNTLSIAGNKLLSEGGFLLGTAIEQNKGLFSIDANQASIGDRGAESIGRALKKNVRLTHLYLSSNGIGDKGAAAIARGVEHNPSLTLMALLGNNIGAVGVNAFVKKLKYNGVLASLPLSKNKMNAGALRKLKAMFTNTAIEERRKKFPPRRRKSLRHQRKPARRSADADEADDDAHLDERDDWRNSPTSWKVGGVPATVIGIAILVGVLAGVCSARKANKERAAKKRKKRKEKAARPKKMRSLPREESDDDEAGEGLLSSLRKGASGRPRKGGKPRNDSFAEGEERDLECGVLDREDDQGLPVAMPGVTAREADTISASPTSATRKLTNASATDTHTHSSSGRQGRSNDRSQQRRGSGEMRSRSPKSAKKRSLQAGDDI